MTDDVAKVAAGLTPAQKRWVLHGEPINRSGYWPLRHAMYGKGLLDAHENLSPFGLAVRALLNQDKRP